MNLELDIQNLQQSYEDYRYSKDVITSHACMDRKTMKWQGVYRQDVLFVRTHPSHVFGAELHNIACLHGPEDQEIAGRVPARRSHRPNSPEPCVCC